MAAYTALKKEPPPLYPVVYYYDIFIIGFFWALTRDPLPLSNAKELEYMVDITHELLQRFHDSPFYLEKEQKRDFRRYTDKYCSTKKDEFEPFWNRIPAELNWKKRSKDTKPAAKKRRTEKLATFTEENLQRLEQAENMDKSKEAVPPEEKDEELEDEQEEHGIVEDDEEAISDEDYLEGENDYVQTYFDAGDDFDADDDNIDEDAY
uniref:DNA-directed RNA polymerase III subunit n=1 Tax=Acrobeloides nanus TaxID=290746 RepID=A0A914EBB8_9BILA